MSLGPLLLWPLQKRCPNQQSTSVEQERLRQSSLRTLFKLLPQLSRTTTSAHFALSIITSSREHSRYSLERCLSLATHSCSYMALATTVQAELSAVIRLIPSARDRCMQSHQLAIRAKQAMQPLLSSSHLPRA